MLQVRKPQVKIWLHLNALSVGLLWIYLLDVLLLDRTVFGLRIRLPYFLVISVVSFAFIYWALHWLIKRRILALSRLQDLCLAVSVSVCAIILVDIGFSVWLNALGASEPVRESTADDQYLLMGELSPRFFYPTTRNFRLLKPKVKLAGAHYGAYYLPRLMKSSTLAQSVFQLKHVSYSIDEYGFRETVSPLDAKVFALGDSFVFGHGVDQTRSWVKLLEDVIETPVYNLGISGASPKDELMLLEHVLQRNPESFKIKQLLWMIYEGNDLEDSYQTYRDVPSEKRGLSDLFAGTVLEAAGAFPFLIEKESVIRKLIDRKMNFALPGLLQGFNPNWIDGVSLPTSLYHSRSYGYRFFHQVDLDRVSQPQSYVLNHPNRPLLDQVFRHMAELSRRLQFSVKVLIAPSAVRLYAHYFEHFPKISTRPYFIEYVADLSSRTGFEVVNLQTLMEPYVKRELLYFRDDTHWTERGNQVVANIVAEELFGRK
jgi:hypothetical protein